MYNVTYIIIYTLKQASKNNDQLCIEKVQIQRLNKILSSLRPGICTYICSNECIFSLNH